MSARWRVRVLTRNREFAPFSPELSLDDALAEQARVKRDVERIGGGWDLVLFNRSTGQPVEIRARDITAVEILQPARNRQPATTRQPFVDEVPPAPAPAPARPLALVDQPAELAPTAGPEPTAPSPGTQYLQSLEGRHPQVRPAPRGGTR